MDDIQFWLYLAFALIYFITRGLKKKEPVKPPQQDDQTERQPGRQSKPVTFEELLKEFTEGKQERVEEEKIPQPVEARQLVKEREWVEAQKPRNFEEGRTRRFADDESRRVYEESIKLAEGSKLDFERADSFKSKLKRRDADEEGDNVAADIKAMLQDHHSAKRAIVLGEILNRKY